MDVGLECVMSNRAIRRHHRERLKKRTRKILASNYFSKYFPYWHNNLEFHVNVRWNNMQICSCHMCGNPRKYYNDLTFQELKENDRYSDDLKELTNTQ